MYNKRSICALNAISMAAQRCEGFAPGWVAGLLYSRRMPGGSMVRPKVRDVESKWFEHSWKG